MGNLAETPRERQIRLLFVCGLWICPTRECESYGVVQVDDRGANVYSDAPWCSLCTAELVRVYRASD